MQKARPGANAAQNAALPVPNFPPNSAEGGQAHSSTNANNNRNHNHNHNHHHHHNHNHSHSHSHNNISNSSSKSRPGTSSGAGAEPGSQPTTPRPKVLIKDRDRRVTRKASWNSFATSPVRPGGRRRANSSSSVTSGPDGRRPRLTVVTDNSAPPALPDFALAAAAKLTRETEVLAPSPTSTDFSSKKMSGRTSATPTNGFPTMPTTIPPPSAGGLQSESSMVHQHIQEMANKRISTLDYLRKAHEGRVYWFNTVLFDKPDLARMPYFDSRRLARRATNYLLLGLSLPTVIDTGVTPIEFLRGLNQLLAEFDSFQQLHSDSGSTGSSLTRAARIPQMFRRAAPSSKSRRSSSAANDIGYPLEPTDSNGGGGGPGSGSIAGSGSGAGGMGGALGGSASVVSFGQTEADLLPGEEYAHLLTPSLPFDPDFFETFATLCDVLIDCYTRLLGLLPTARECSGQVAELFTKADSKVRKIIIQGIVKEFEDSSRSGIKTEVANVGKIVLGGLM